MAWPPAKWVPISPKPIPRPSSTPGRAQFTRNNGYIATVVVVDFQGARIIVENQDGERQMLGLAEFIDLQARHEWVVPNHSTQDVTARHVMAIWNSCAPTLSDAVALYVANRADAPRCARLM